MNIETWKKMAVDMAAAMKEFVARSLEPRDARIDAIDKRLTELEARPSMEYMGTWDAAKIYGRGAVVTSGGSMWHAQRASVSRRPGQSDDWVQCVQRGKPGERGPKGEDAR
jgi:hypothetical protein